MEILGSPAAVSIPPVGRKDKQEVTDIFSGRPLALGVSQKTCRCRPCIAPRFVLRAYEETFAIKSRGMDWMDNI